MKWLRRLFGLDYKINIGKSHFMLGESTKPINPANYNLGNAPPSRPFPTKNLSQKEIKDWVKYFTKQVKKAQKRKK